MYTAQTRNYLDTITNYYSKEIIQSVDGKCSIGFALKRASDILKSKSPDVFAELPDEISVIEFKDETDNLIQLYEKLSAELFHIEILEKMIQKEKMKLASELPISYDELIVDQVRYLYREIKNFAIDAKYPEVVDIATFAELIRDARKIREYPFDAKGLLVMTQDEICHLVKAATICKDILVKIEFIKQLIF